MLEPLTDCRWDIFSFLSWGVLVLLKFYWAPDIVEFVLGRFSHFNIAITYSNSTFCGAWTPSFCEFTQNFSKTSTPQDLYRILLKAESEGILHDVDMAEVEKLILCPILSHQDTKVIKESGNFSVV